MIAVSGHGFRRRFTAAELTEIAKLRHEMRSRLLCSAINCGCVGICARDRDGARSAETRSGSGPQKDCQARAEGIAQIGEPK